MGQRHLNLAWGELLWSYLWMDNIHSFAHKWRILACTTMKGSDHRLHHMLRNKGGVGLL